MADPTFWDQRYGEPGFAYGDAPNDFLAEVEPQLPRGSRVLCLAEGEGRNGVFLASRGHHVTGIEGSAVGVEKARRLAADRGVTADFQIGDLATAPLPAEVDVVVSIFAHLPPALRRDVARRAEAALVPGGWVVVEAYRPAQLELGTGGPKQREWLVSLEDLDSEFAGCERIRGGDVEREVIEGKYHTGRAAVVQAILRKRG